MARLTPKSSTVNKALSFPVRAGLHHTLLKFQYGSKGFFHIKRKIDPAHIKPTLKKRYPIRPKLRHRIFYPPAEKMGMHPPPLYLDIHGGAWILCEPSFDDTSNSDMAHNWGCMVISLDYTKAPGAMFPTPIYELVDCILAILNDPTLNFDQSRVVLGGYSAGGNLALGVAQDKRLRGLIKGLVPFYPLCDWSLDVKTRASTREYIKPTDTDLLLKGGPLIGTFFNHVYCEGGADLRNPQLSPAWADRQDMPEWIFCIAAQFDILGNESGAMMGRFAGIPLGKVGGEYKGHKTGKADGLVGPEKFGFEAEDGRLRFQMIEGIKHG